MRGTFASQKCGRFMRIENCSTCLVNRANPSPILSPAYRVPTSPDQLKPTMPADEGVFVPASVLLQRLHGTGKIALPWAG